LTGGGLQLDVADLDLAQFAKDGLRRHGARLGSIALLGVRFADERLQVGPFGQVVEGFPQGVGKHAHEDVRLGAAAVLVPDGAQQQMTFQDVKGALHDRELDVGLPEFLSRPTGVIAAQQVGAVAGQGLLELADVPGAVY